MCEISALVALKWLNFIVSATPTLCVTNEHFLTSSKENPRNDNQVQIPAGILSASEYTILCDFCFILVFSGNTSSSSLQYTDLKPIQVSNLVQLENPIQLENNQRSSSQSSNSATTIREPGITFLQSTFTWLLLKCRKILIILHFEFELQRLSSWTIPASVVRMRSSTKQLPTFCTQLVSSETENNSSWSVFLKTVRLPFQTSLIWEYMMKRASKDASCLACFLFWAWKQLPITLKTV